MEDVNRIADYFIWFADEHGDLITHLKLQKLCFFAEAFYLATKEKPLTGEPFEAWAHGPVSRTLWQRFKEYKNKPLNAEDDPIDDDIGAIELEYHYEEPELLESSKKYLQDVIACFWGKSAWELEYITHTHMPWKKARGNLDILEPCDRVIKEKDIIKFYKEYIDNASLQKNV